MNKKALIDVLQKNKHLRTTAEVAAFDEALAALAQSPNDQDLPALHLIFTDDCLHQEAMFGLVHFLESFDMKKQLAAFIEAVPTMSTQAPEWTKILLCRVMNDGASREHFKNLYEFATPAVKERVKFLLLQVQPDDAEFSSQVRQLVA